jgi:hypothetical protein
VANATKEQLENAGKEINVDDHFIRDHIKDKLIHISFCRSADNKSDGFTKALDATKHKRFVESLGMMSRTEFIKKFGAPA